MCEKTFDETDIAKIAYMVDHHFSYRFYLDGMPSATVMSDPVTSQDGHMDKFRTYHEGCPVGYHTEAGDLVIFNHFEFTIKVRKISGSTDRNRIVGFEVYP
jgi:hypothetical protein